MEYPSCVGKKCTILPPVPQGKVRNLRKEIHTLKQKLIDDLLMSADDKRDINNQIAGVQKKIDKEFYDVFNSDMDGVDDNLAHVSSLVGSAREDLASAQMKMERASSSVSSARNMAEEAIQNKT
jgi:predicted  nucleic acid-binding Zn-ribbon protein